jgi:hypothetical protein
MAQSLTLATPAMMGPHGASDTHSDKAECSESYELLESGSQGNRHADCASVVSTAIGLVMKRPR